MKQIFLHLILSILLFFTNLSGQDIVKVEYLSSINQVTFNTIISSFLSNIDATSGADLYKVTYTTTGSDMKKDTASGLLSIPDNITEPLPLLNYQHGTTDGRSAVPSNLSGTEYFLASAFSGLGFISFAPDYLGMGTSRGFHPYVHAETEATAMIDMLFAVKSYLSENQIAFSDQLFITGYSQGGHAAMAAHKKIEEDYEGELTVTASLPMSGPYSVSGVMKNLAFSEEEFFFPSYLVYSALGAKAIYPDLFEDLSEIFREEFISTIRPFAETGEGLFSMNVAILDIMETQFGGSFPMFLFKDDVLDELKFNPENQLNVVLRENDLFDWVPKAPTLILYCKSDDQVPYRNSVIADSVMNELGAENVSSIDVANGRNLDHGGCIFPALETGIPWLLAHKALTIPTDEVVTDNNQFNIFPNPAQNQIIIESLEYEIDFIEILDINGQLIQHINTSSKYQVIPIHTLETGLYIVRISSDLGSNFQKIVVEK